MWNRISGFAIKRAVHRWKLEGLGLRFDAAGFPEGDNADFIFRFADDCILASDTFQGLERMFCILTEELRRIDLDWKPGSLSCFCAGGGWPDPAVNWCGFEISLVE